MQITVNLLELDKKPDLSRAIAVAILSALSPDEAEKAISEWHGVQLVREGGDLAQLDAEAIGDALQAQTRVAVDEWQRERDARIADPIPTVNMGRPYTHIDELPKLSDRLDQVLSPRASKALMKAGYETLLDLDQVSPQHLLDTVDNFGHRSLVEVTAAIAKAGLKLADGTVSKPAPEPAPEPAPLALAAVTVATQPELFGNGSSTDPASMDLRALIRHAQYHLGMPRSQELWKASGINTIAAATEEQKTTLRNSIFAALSA